MGEERQLVAVVAPPSRPWRGRLRLDPDRMGPTRAASLAASRGPQLNAHHREYLSVAGACKSGRQDLNLRSLGPESGLGETAGTDKARTESQGLGNTWDLESAPNAPGALSVSAVTQLGEPVGTNSPAGFLVAALCLLGRDGEPTRELLQEIEGLVRHALRALGDAGEAPAWPSRGKGI